MKNYLFKKLYLILIFIFFALSIETLTFFLMRFGFLPRYPFLDISIILFLAGVLFIIPSTRIQVAAASVLLLLQSFLSFANINLYKLYGDIFTVNLLVYAFEATKVISNDFVNFKLLTVFVLLLGIFISLSVIFCRLLKSEAAFNKKITVAFVSVFMVSCLFSPSMYYGQVKVIDNNKEEAVFGLSKYDNYNDLIFPSSYLSNFGMYTLYYKNIVQAKPRGSMLFRVSEEELADYLKNAPDTFKSKYFGADEGNNLIVVMLESFDEIFVNKYTPTISKILNEGVHFTNYHANAKTDYSEASVILGNYPETENLVAPWSDGGGKDKDMRSGAYNNFSFSLPNVLKENGFAQAAYFHSNTGYYYSRKYTHPEYGFDKTFFLEDYPENKNYPDYPQYVNDTAWCMPEEYFINSALEDMLPKDKRFFSFFMTMNLHGGYSSLYGENDESLNHYAKDRRNKINDNDFPEINKAEFYSQYKNALAKAMAVDDGIKYLLEQLEERGLSDKTTLLFVADHNAYSNNLTYDYRKTTAQMSSSFTLPCVIYSPSLKNIKIDKFTATFDITPTLFDLLGIDYNPRMYLGYNAFSNERSVVISRIGGIFNDNFYSDGIDILYKKPDASDGDYEKFRNDYFNVIEKWSYIELLFKR